MGTRSTTKILDESGNVLVTLYRQFDGYLSGHGKELADFLSARTLINGFGTGQTANEFANGMGCLAAQLITSLKTKEDGSMQIGNIYVTNAGDSQSYDYTVYQNGNGQLCIKAESYGKLLFDGLATEFNDNEGDEDDE